MDARINMVMVSARNINVLRAFYEQGLGWTPWMPASEGSVAYKVGTSVLIFVNATYLAQESGIAEVEGPKSIWAVFVPTRAEVEAVFNRAIRAGAEVASPIRDRDQGLYSGYFTDPEGNGWEVVWSPHMPLGEDGALELPGAA